MQVFRTIRNFPRYTPVRDLHTAFNLPYVYDYITKLCRQQAEVIQNHYNEHVHSIGKARPDLENIWGLNLAVVKLTTFEMTKLPMYHKIIKIGMICFAKPGLTEDLYIVKKEKFSKTCYICDMYTWKKAMHIHKINPSSRQRGCYIRTMIARVQSQKKNLVVILKEHGAKMIWLALNRQS
jgi:hypothetical protein